MNYNIEELPNPTPTDRLFGYVSFNKLFPYIEERETPDASNNVLLVLRFNSIKKVSDYNYYNFDLLGIYSRVSNCSINSHFRELANLKGVSFTENRGQYLRDAFRDKPFFVFKIYPIIHRPDSNEFYYTFNVAPVSECDIPVYESDFEKRQCFYSNSCIERDDSFMFHPK